MTNKKRYIKLMKKTSVCVANTGLSNSTGWKMGEYVAASKAIVCEPLNYEVPGNFVEGINYLSFASNRECISKIDYLLTNKEALRKMETANYCWYSNYGSPDIIVSHCIEIINSNNK